MAIAIALASACDSPSNPGGGTDVWQRQQDAGVSVEFRTDDAALSSAILDRAVYGKSAVEAFFGRPLQTPFVARIYPDRESLSSYWRSEWNQPNLQVQCWMIASANRDMLVVLSPRVWATQACGHDAASSSYVRAVVTHEIVHILHRRANPSATFVGQHDLWWFVEGAAVYASGQYDEATKARVRSLLANGYSPQTPQAAFEGSGGYDAAGSMAHYIDDRFGRATLSLILEAVTEADLFARLGTPRNEFLQNWREYVLQ